jgi:hypothetical protein
MTINKLFEYAVKPETVDYATYTHIPMSMMTSEVGGLYGSAVLQELNQLIKMYGVYEHGVGFTSDTLSDGFVSSDLRFKKVAQLIDKVARHMFAVKPDTIITIPYDRKNKSLKDLAHKQQSILQDFVTNVLKENRVKNALLAACKDALIARRVAWVLNFSPVSGRITLRFIPSLGFVYETNEETGELSKIVFFHAMNNETDSHQQRIFKKKYYMDNGFCFVDEHIYDGVGNVIQRLSEALKTKLNHIPAGVILNDGLTGDMLGVSEIERLNNFEGWFNKLSNADIDAERQGMNPVRYLMDVDTTTSGKLSNAPGSLWDLGSDDPDKQQGTAGVLELQFAYSKAIGSTLERIDQSAHDAMDVPDVSSKALQGVVSSGKTLEAIYWGLGVRCDEKFHVWGDALEQIVRDIIEGAKLYPECLKRYTEETLPVGKYEVQITRNSPIPKDDTAEKEADMLEVARGIRSKKSYMLKWGDGLTEDDVAEELAQIVREKQDEESSYMPFVEQATKSKPLNGQTEDDSSEEDDSAQ